MNHSNMQLTSGLRPGPAQRRTLARLSTFVRKREQSAPRPELQRYGLATEQTDFQQGRYSDGVTRKLEELNALSLGGVGPGIGSGYSSKATGG
jgi:hypothetical protein